MGKDCGSWQQHYPWQSPNPNCVSIPPDLGELNIAHSMAYPLYANQCPVSPSGAGFVVPENPELKSFRGNKLQAWYSYYPQQTLSPTPESITGEKFYVSHCGEAATNQKRFLVFDQSGNRTSLVFSSVGYPFQHPFSSTLKQSEAINKDTPILDSVKKQDYPWLDEKQHETHVSGGGSGSEMHEDTEELDALLYSDDDEETSTGHSPSEMTDHENNEANDDCTEVGSSVTPIKRRRFEHDQALMDTASSGKDLDLEDDAQSSCVRGDPSEGSFSSKRLRRERIRETVGILRSIIPGGKGNKDAIVLLDEAIGYLNSMRMKAKALGAGAAAAAAIWQHQPQPH